MYISHNLCQVQLNYMHIIINFNINVDRLKRHDTFYYITFKIMINLLDKHRNITLRQSTNITL